MNKTAPFILDNFAPFTGRIKKSNSIDVPSIQKTSIFNIISLICNGVIILDIPNTPRRLKIFDPIMLPMEISISFLNAAIIDVASSGTLVPKAIAEMEITLSLIPRLVAITDALLTRR